MFVFHRVKVINSFEVARNFFFRRLVDLFLHAIDDGLHFCCFLNDAIEPIDSGRVRAVIEGQCRMITEKLRDRGSVLIVDQQRRLL